MSSGSTIDRKARAICRRPASGTRGLPLALASEGLGPTMANGLESAFDHAHEDPVSPHKVMVKRGALDAL